MTRSTTSQVVLIDTNEKLLTFLTGHLSDHAIEFLCPSSIPHIQDHDPTIVVLNLPVLEGKEEKILKKLQKEVPYAALVALCADESQALMAMRQGCSQAVLVPFSQEELLDAIRRASKQSGLRAELRELKRQRRRLLRRNRKLRKEIRDLLAIGELARTVTGSLLIEEVLKRILSGIRSVLGLDRVVLGLINTGSGTEEIKLAVGVYGLELKDACWSVQEQDPVWSHLLEKQTPLVIAPSHLATLPDFVRRIFNHAFVKAPMIVKGQVIGTIMGERTSQAIGPRDLWLLEIFAEYAGIAIENGRLYYDVIRSEEALKRAQKQLVEAERLAVIGQMAVSINHEINNPLCNISLIAQTLKKELENRSPELAARMEGIRESVERIQRVTQRLSELKNADPVEYLPNRLMINLQ